jgi:hypothetical protein
LKVLTLAGAACDDASAAALAAAIPTLRQLHIADSSITDAGILLLAAIPGLQELSAYKSPVTAQGVAAVQAKYPRINIWSTLPTPAPTSATGNQANPQDPVK